MLCCLPACRIHYDLPVCTSPSARRQLPYGAREAPGLRKAPRPSPSCLTVLLQPSPCQPSHPHLEPVPFGHGTVVSLCEPMTLCIAREAQCHGRVITESAPLAGPVDHIIWFHNNPYLAHTRHPPTPLAPRKQFMRLACRRVDPEAQRGRPLLVRHPLLAVPHLSPSAGCHSSSPQPHHPPDVRSCEVPDDRT